VEDFSRYALYSRERYKLRVMKSTNYVIVEVEEAYNNQEEILDGEKLIVNSTIESVSHINRVATVKSAPHFTLLERGDKVIIHHNILRSKHSVSGRQVRSDFHIEDNLYFVPLTEIFMYKRGSLWEAITPFCFVQPMNLDQGGELLLGVKKDYLGREHQKGILTHPNKELIEIGCKKGSIVMFSEHSEYEFNIEGTLYYRMKTRDIRAIE